MVIVCIYLFINVLRIVLILRLTELNVLKRKITLVSQLEFQSRNSKINMDLLIVRHVIVYFYVMVLLE